MVGLGRQLLQINHLCAAIAFAKGMDVIDVAHDRADGNGKVGKVQLLEKIAGNQTPMDIGHAGLNVTAKLELTAALGDFDRSDLAGPVVDVLEQVTVDGFQVGEIELAARDSAITAASYELPFDAV